MLYLPIGVPDLGNEKKHQKLQQKNVFSGIYFCRAGGKRPTPLEHDLMIYYTGEMKVTYLRRTLLTVRPSRTGFRAKTGTERPAETLPL